MDFDFSEWKELARNDPKEFERRRVAMIEAVIASAPPDVQRRLRGIQFRVDMECRKASNPLSATVRISRMMWESFAELREALNKLTSPGPAQPIPKPASNIVPLRQRGTE
ncbi:MAG: DUF3135 domain-containing protein [Burkholderiales bacterium]